MKRSRNIMILAMAVVMAFTLCTASAGAAEWPWPNKIKNVIVMIPDGCDETVQTVARWYKGEDLQVDKMAGGGVKQHMADSVITDSAAAATAFACGDKTSDGFVGVGPRADTLLSCFDPAEMAPPYAPIASVLEAAKARGKATGIAVTCRVSHATPAAFASHVHSRSLDNDIIEHMVYNNIDVVFGGGARHLIPDGESYTTSFGATWGGKRTDGENLIDALLNRGYEFIDNRNDMLALTSGRVWGLFDDSHMQPDIDRQYFAPHEPSLAEMVSKAIELLSQDEDGFFLMVEGSQVDWAGHNNDPIYMVTDFIAFDDAVKVACDFADMDGRTLVMAFPDHNTGGMKIGHYYTPMKYTKTAVEDLVEPLKGMTITSPGLVAMMNNEADNTELIQTVADYWSLNITMDDVNAIRDLEPEVGLAYALARVLSERYTIIGWTTHGHNGETIPLWMQGQEAPAGIIDNTDLAKMAAEAMGANLDNMTNYLYVDLSTVTGFFVVDDSDPENLVLKVNGAELPINKDYMTYRGRTFYLPGVTVYAPETGNVYVSAWALRILRLI